MEKIKKKKTILIIIFSVLLITIAGTFAYLTWTKKIGRLVLRIGDLNTTEVRVSPYIIEGSFSPTLTYTGNTYTSVRATNNKSEASKIILYYDIKNIDSALVSQYMKYMITKSESLNGTYTEYTSGNFSSVATGDMMEILRESVPANTIYYYRVYLWIDGTTGNQNDMIGKNISLEFYAKILESTGATLLIDKANMESLSYGSATDDQKKEMWTFSHEATEQVGATTDYRYIGSNPNNYITFNNETWRIIGVFDERIKIIRQDSLGNMARDYKQSGVGSSTSSSGSNDWSDSQLMYMINSNWLTTGSDILKSGYTFDGTYVKDGNGKIIYQKGCKPNSTSGTTYNCSSNTWSLNDQALTQIDIVTYYLGGSGSYDHNGASYYTFERGTTVYTNRPTNWSGYVGLAYPSDYIYTFANGVDETCFNNGYNCYSDTPTSSWMKAMYGSNDQWLVSSHSGYANRGFNVDSSGSVNSATYVSNSYGVRPTVYLKSNIKLQGSGTSSDPYTIVTGTAVDKLNEPVLDDGMVPVTIANNGEVTTISKDADGWYDYDNKKWANAVLVDSSVRSTYLGTTGKTIPSDKILAYFVWIPRYKYKIWTNETEWGDGSTYSSTQEIDIVWENSLNKTTGSNIGDYITHPAFTFGNQELDGIWVGKFETTGEAEENALPTIIPNQFSLTLQTVSEQFKTALSFAGGTLNSSTGTVSFAGNNTYGLTSTTNSHMAKNTEWGAVAYLSHSKYGINGALRINNYENSGSPFSGCGAATANEDSSTTCGIAYGSATSYPQSTTGNISGVFDMAGGADEYVMANFANITGYDSSYNSGFNGDLSDGSTYSSGVPFPTSEYYNLYKASDFMENGVNDILKCTIATCGGHALMETFDWYGNSLQFVESSTPWFLRGGDMSSGEYGGIFSGEVADGHAEYYYGFRVVLIR